MWNYPVPRRFYFIKLKGMYRMNYVQLIRRIATLQSAQIRAMHYADRHPETDIDFEIADKIDYLKKSIKDWYTDDRPTRRRRSKQVRLACRLLRVDYHSMMP